MSDLDFDDIIIGARPPAKPAQSQPVQATEQPQVVIAQASQPVRQGVHPAWAAMLAFSTVTFALLWLSTFITIPNPGPSPDPNVDPVDGAYVAMFYDDEEKGTYSQDQVVAMDSAAMAEYLDGKVTGWKKIDVDQLDELKHLNPIYSELADQHRSKLPWIVVRSGRSLGSEPIENPDQVIKVIERTLK